LEKDLEALDEQGILNGVLTLLNQYWRIVFCKRKKFQCRIGRHWC
jgi:hypothetical protein